MTHLLFHLGSYLSGKPKVQNPASKQQGCGVGVGEIFNYGVVVGVAISKKVGVGISEKLGVGIFRIFVVGVGD